MDGRIANPPELGRLVCFCEVPLLFVENNAISFAETDLLLPLQVIGRSPVRINKHEYEETIVNSLVGICRMPRA